MKPFLLTPKTYSQLSRRDFLKIMGVIGGAAALTSLPHAAQAAFHLDEGMVDTSIYKKAGPWKIAHSSQGPTNSWMVLYDAHIKYGATELYKDQFSEFIYTDCNGNADKQVNDMQDILVQKPDIIILSPVGSAALVSVVEEAMSKNIPIILGSSKVDTDNYITFVEPNNITYGQECAKYLVKKLNGKGNVIMLSGIAGASAAEDRLKGGREIFAQAPDIKEIGQAYCDWSPAIGKEKTAAFIAANEQIDGVWSDSGVMSIGAIQAFQEAKRPIPPLTGEQFNGYLRALVTNNLDGFAVLYPQSLGLTCVELAIKTMNGEAIDHYTPVDLPSFSDAEIKDKLYAPDMPDDYWPGNKLPQEWIDKLFKKS